MDDPLIVPFTKESPFLIPFMRTFASMRRVGVLSDIIKSYKSQEVKQCSTGMVCDETLELIIFFSFRLLSNFSFSDFPWIQASYDSNSDICRWHDH